MRSTPSPSQRYLAKPHRRKLLLSIGLIFLSVFLWRGYDILIGENLDVITPGKAYRSAQLTGSRLRAEIKTLGLRTVINLRGENLQDKWYHEEIAACESAQIQHYDIPMSAVQLPSPRAVEELVEVLKTAPRPILIHCKNGADRTGLASAIWLVLDRGDDPSKASAEGLTLWHGHMPLGPTTVMDQFFKLHVQTGRGMDFEKWLRQKYPTEYAHHLKTFQSVN